MKLAVFTSRYPAKTATFFERDMRSLVEDGFEIDIFCIRPLQPDLWKYSSGLVGMRGFSAERIFHPALGPQLRTAGGALSQRPGAHLRDAASVMRSAFRFGPTAAAKTAAVLPMAWAWAAQAVAYDQVLAYWGNFPGTAAWAFHRLIGRDIPFSIWLHAGVDLYGSPVFLREKLAYADTIITCCEFNRDYITRCYGDDPELLARLHVCHHGLDTDEYDYRPDNRRDGVIMAVGRLVANKGFDYLLMAAKQLAERGVAFSIEFVGEGPERPNLEQLAQKLGIAGQVRFRGWMTPADARRAMGEPTLLVHPSPCLGDGLPNVVREGMALGTPVVATRVAGIPDALEGGCGVLVPPREVEPLADAIEALLGDPGLRRKIADRARHKVETRYDRRRSGSQLAGLLRATRRRPALTTTEPALSAAVAREAY